MIPNRTARNLDVIAEWTTRTRLADLTTWATDLHRRAAAGSPDPDGFSAGGAPESGRVSQGQKVPDPTGEQAMVPAGQWDPVQERCDELQGHLAALADRMHAINRLKRLDEEQLTPSVPWAHTEPECCEKHCESVADGPAGRCKACDSWRRAWVAREQRRRFSEGLPHAGVSKADCPPVPASEVDARTPPSRVHVSGPLAKETP